jgi:alkanesulfonate monooxygenase SsuD/methylene tetrahydromethanopterin reductase-like flavin-dependent oxidoreductase (luciferase family)/putative sterol carrier protein
VRFGLFYEHQIARPWREGDEERLLRDALEQVELADRLGFDSVWEVEHHFLEEYSHSSAPEVFLAAASQRTRRMRLGHGIVQLPPNFNHPARVAERIATLDLVSGGRVEFGTGESGSQMELGGFRIDRGLKHAQWEEALDAITRMFVEEPFAGYQGRFLSMPPRNVVPKPKQKPHPPLWVACSRRETIRTAARKGIGALSFSFIEPEEAKEWVDDYYRIIASEECVPAGFAVNPNVAVVVPLLCHADEQTAIERGIDGAHFFGYSLAYYYVFGQHQPGRTNLWEEFQRNRNQYGFAREIVRAEDAPLGVKLLQHGMGSLRGAVGTPAQIADLVRRYECAGVDAVIFVSQAGHNRHEHICESIELFAREVLPPFAETAEAVEAEKGARLAEACERARARRLPPRKLETEYVVTSHGETTKQGRDSPVARVLDPLMSFPAVQWLIFRGMARSLRGRTNGFQGAVEYRLRGVKGEACWTLQIDGERVSARRGPADKPVLIFRTTLRVFARIAAGYLNPAHAILERKLEVEGDVKALARFSALFENRGKPGTDGT